MKDNEIPNRRRINKNSSFSSQTSKPRSFSNKDNRLNSYKKKGSFRNSTPEEQPVKRYPNPKEGSIRIIFLGGVGEIGKNIYAVEYKDSIILLECGSTFAENNTPGVNILMSNIQYLENRAKNVKAIFVTDSSRTHSGAIPYVNDLLSPCTIYTREITKIVTENRMEETHKKSNIDFNIVEKEQTIKISDGMDVHLFGFSDKTPSSFGLVIETPEGCISYTGNLRVDHNKEVIPVSEIKRFKILQEKDILVALADSVNVERPGFAATDDSINDDVKLMMEQSKGNRIIMPLFASNLRRNSLFIENAIRLGRRVYVQGKTLHKNIIAAIDLGILDLPHEIIQPIEELKEIDDQKKALILVTSGENEDYRTLETIANGSNRYLGVEIGDVFIFPSPMVPTRSAETQNVKDDLSREGATIRSYETNDVKASAHAGKAELKWMLELTRPRFFIPVQGYHYMMTAHVHILKEISRSLDDAALPDNGTVIDITKNNMLVHKKHVPSTPIAIDSNIPTPLQEVVIQDRKILSEDGIFIVIIFFDKKTLMLKKSPDIISRGFIYLRESQELIGRTRLFVKKTAEEAGQEAKTIDIITIKKSIQKSVSNFLLKETNKKPIVVPVIFT